MRKKLLILIASALLISPLPALAQIGQSATMTGTVTDSTGGVLPGVTVTVTNVGTAESGQPYNFYAHNMTPSVCNLIEAVDLERVSVAAAFGIKTPDVFKWLEATYNRKEVSLHWSMQANAVTHYR